MSVIVSASRRPDIPALDSQWLVNRLEAGEVLVPEPYRPGHLGRVRHSSDMVDCMVFWAQNPAPCWISWRAWTSLAANPIFSFPLTAGMPRRACRSP